MNNMESFHCGMKKQLQNLPNQSGSLANFGLEKFENSLQLSKAYNLFIWQLLSLYFKCMCQEIMPDYITDVVNRGPLCSILNVLRIWAVSLYYVCN
jgi:hypothetical protein